MDLKLIGFKQLPIILIVAIGLWLRMYQLGSYPISLNWDEAAYGYNTFSLLHTGKDEYGRTWPVMISSEDNLIHAAYAYLSMGPVALLGLNEFSIRLVAAILGVATIGLTYKFVRQMAGSRTWALGASLLLAINPWHVQASRLAVPLTATVFVLTLVVYWLNLSVRRHPAYLLAAMITMSVGFYVYSPALVIGPLLVAGWLLLYRKYFLRMRLWVMMGSLISLVLIWPLVINPESSYRFKKANFLIGTWKSGSVVSAQQILTDTKQSLGWIGRLVHNRRLIVPREYAKNYFRYWDINFLFLDSSNQRMFYNTNLGLFYLWELPLWVFGAYGLIRSKLKGVKFLMWWWLTAPAGAALGLGAPIAWRAVTFLPVSSIVAAYGLNYLLIKIKNIRPTWLRSGAGSFMVIASLSGSYFWHQYTVHSPTEFAPGWRDGMKQMALTLEDVSDNYDRVIISNDFKAPYIYLLFYQQINPAWLQSQNQSAHYKSFGKYEFRKIDWAKDAKLKRVVMVASESNIPSDKTEILYRIRRRDNSIAAVIATPKP